MDTRLQWHYHCYTDNICFMPYPSEGKLEVPRLVAWISGYHAYHLLYNDHPRWDNSPLINRKNKMAHK